MKKLENTIVDILCVSLPLQADFSHWKSRWPPSPMRVSSTGPRLARSRLEPSPRCRIPAHVSPSPRVLARVPRVPVTLVGVVVVVDVQVPAAHL